MSSLIQILLFAISAFLSFTPGNALKCRQAGTDDVDPGSPPGQCEALPGLGICYVKLIRYEKHVSGQIFHDCGRKGFISCGSEKFDSSTKMWTKFFCCSNKDFCNDYFSFT